MIEGQGIRSWEGREVLCTNDDGYMALGLAALAEAAAAGGLGPVTVVAPDREQSATSHSLTLHHPLRARRAPNGMHVVDGTPTDCVILAVNALLQTHPAVCLSGINHGPNMGEDVLYSGTVAAAMEATVIGIPAIAVSYTGSAPEEIAGWVQPLGALLASLLAHPFPAHTLFNINLPAIDPAELRGVRVTRLGRRRYEDSLTRALDPMGREYFWIGGGTSRWQGGDDSDFRAVAEGYISVTPLHLDLTDLTLLEEVRTWNLAP
jgi:5'-nucleotidase